MLAMSEGSVMSVGTARAAGPSSAASACSLSAERAGQCELAAKLGERAGRCRADASAGAGDNDDFAIENVCHMVNSEVVRLGLWDVCRILPRSHVQPNRTSSTPNVSRFVSS